MRLVAHGIGGVTRFAQHLTAEPQHRVGPHHQGVVIGVEARRDVGGLRPRQSQCDAVGISREGGIPDGEPLDVASPLWDLPNVIATPHTASHSLGQNEAILDIFLGTDLDLRHRPRPGRTQ